MLSHPHHSTRLTVNSPPNLPLWLHILPIIQDYSHSSKVHLEHWMALIFLHALLLQINPAIKITKEGSHRMSWLPLHSTCTFSTSSVNGMEVPQMGVSFMMHIFMTWRSQMEITT